MRGYLAAIGLALMLVVAGLSYTQGKAAGKTQCLAERSIAADKAQTAIDLRDQSSATARVDMLDYLRVTVPPIEIRTHDTIERIRTVYENRVIPADCRVAIARPERVSEELSKARNAANAATRGLRRTTPITDPRSP